jgi:hypothetical protein
MAWLRGTGATSTPLPCTRKAPARRTERAFLGFFAEREDSEDRGEAFPPLAADLVETVLQGINP